MYDDRRNMRAQRAGFKRHDQRDRNHSALRAQIDAVRSGLSVIASTGAETTPIRVEPFAELFDRITKQLAQSRKQSKKPRRRRSYRTSSDGTTPIARARSGDLTPLSKILGNVVRDIVMTAEPHKRSAVARRFAAALDPANAA